MLGSLLAPCNPNTLAPKIRHFQHKWETSWTTSQTHIPGANWHPQAWPPSTSCHVDGFWMTLHTRISVNCLMVYRTWHGGVFRLSATHNTQQTQTKHGKQQSTTTQCNTSKHNTAPTNTPNTTHTDHTTTIKCTQYTQHEHKHDTTTTSNNNTPRTTNNNTHTVTSTHNSFSGNNKNNNNVQQTGNPHNKHHITNAPLQQQTHNKQHIQRIVCASFVLLTQHIECVCLVCSRCCSNLRLLCFC